jgi:hypothetical protein
MTSQNHFNQTQRRRAEFIRPPNTLRAKVGTGGLSEDILQKAENLLTSLSVDFAPLAEIYLENLIKGVELAKSASMSEDPEYIIATMLYPAVQLKANGGMFKYDLVTKIADKLIQFLETIDQPDIEVVEIVMAFHSAIRALIAGRVSGSGGQKGAELFKALDQACTRYFEKFGVRE